MTGFGCPHPSRCAALGVCQAKCAPSPRQAVGASEFNRMQDVLREVEPAPREWPGPNVRAPLPGAPKGRWP